MHEFVLFLTNGHVVTIQAGAFTKTKHEVLFFKDEIERYRSDEPRYEAAVAAFNHDEIVGFSRKDAVVS